MISISRTRIVALALAMALMAGGSAALAKGQKAKGGNKGEHGMGGTVTAVDASSISIETKKHGTKQFQLAANTVYETKGKKKQANTPITLAAVKKGMRVQIMAAGSQASKVVVRGEGHKGKGKAKAKNK